MAKQELTLKQRKFIKFWMETGNLTEACEKAGYKATTKKSFSEIGRQNLEKLGNRIIPALRAKGLDAFSFANDLHEGLKATYWCGKRELPDFGVRHKYLETQNKIEGFSAPEKKALMGENGGPVELKVIFDKKKGNGADGE